MPSLGDLVVRITGDNSDFNSKVDASEKKFTAFAKSLQNVGKKLTTFVTLPLVGLGVAAVKSAADMEMQAAAFETMLGSAADAKKLLTDLKDLAARTPFQLTDLADASKTLLGFGFSAEKLLPTIRQLGDVAGGNSQRFGQLSLAFAQVQATGRLMGQDLLQMINAGFNPLQEISEKTGISMSELKKQMEAGAISADMVADAFKSATSEGGRFFGGMERASKTLSGVWSTLMDNLAEMGRRFAEILVPAIKNAIAVVSGIAERFQALDEGGKKTVLTVFAIAAAIGPLIFAVGKLIPVIKAVNLAVTTTAWASWATGIGLAVAAIAMVTVGIVGLITAMNDAKKAAQDMKSQFPELDKKFFALAPTETAGRIAQITARIAELNKGLKEAAESPFIPTEEQKKNIAAARVEIAKLNKELETLRGGNARSAEERAKAAEEHAKAWESEAKRINELAASEFQINADRLDQIERLADAEAEMQTARDAAALQVQQDAADEIDALEEVARTTSELIAAAEAGREAAHQRELARQAKEREEMLKSLDMARQIALELVNLARALTDRQLEELRRATQAREKAHDAELRRMDAALKTRLDAHDAELQAALEAAGVAEETTEQRLRREIDAARGAGDEEKAIELEKTLKREQITADFEKRRNDLVAQAAADRADAEKAFDDAIAANRREIALREAKASKAIALFEVLINTASAIVKAAPSIPMMVATGIIGAIQAAIIAAQPLPALAEGGVVMPRAGGVQATIAEAGQAEAVIPLDRLESMLARWPGGDDGGDGGDIHLQVNLDSKPFLDTIFPATRNRRVLISQGAVV